MSLKNLIASDYGQALELTFKDVDTGNAADISAYTTTQVMLFTDPSGTASTKTAAFKTDGTDGIIRYVIPASFLTAGKWRVRGRVTSGSAQLTTVQHVFEVIA